MNYKFTKLFLTLAFLTIGICGVCQDPEDPEVMKQFDEAMEKQVEQMTSSLKLEDWQVFYADSILRHDFIAMRDEMQALGKARVANPDIYQQVQDKWSEQMYNSFHKILNEEQWAKYLKAGAAREKKARDKRAEKK